MKKEICRPWMGHGCSGTGLCADLSDSAGGATVYCDCPAGSSRRAVETMGAPKDLAPTELSVISEWLSLSASQRLESKVETGIAPTFVGQVGFIEMPPVGTAGCACRLDRVGLRCTLDPGHSGPHAAHASPRLMLARWPNGNPQ